MSSGRRATLAQVLRVAARTAADLPERLPGPRGAWLAAAGGALYGAGFASGAVLEQFLVGRARLRPDPVAREPLGRLRGRGCLVETEDGVALQVEEAGLEQAPLTVVLVHGWTMDMGSWHFQRRDLGDRVRLVLYDHRGHGRSGYGSKDRATIDQLGRDLLRVLDATCSGPVVLVGHSLGGMTVMALADAHPELFGDRVVGVCLVTTSAAELMDKPFGLPARIGETVRKGLPLALPVARERAHLVEHGRSLAGDVAFLAVRWFCFGDRHVSPSLVDFVERMNAGTSLEVATDFWDTFVNHDKLEALPVLGQVPTVVVGAELDRLTPVDHARHMAEHIPGARYVELEGAGHMAMLDRHEEVTAVIARLVDEVCPG